MQDRTHGQACYNHNYSREEERKGVEGEESEVVRTENEWMIRKCRLVAAAVEEMRK